jgi:hypothetical protein
VAQATLADALAATEPPEADSVKPWLWGIARHKIADYYRGHREHLTLDSEANLESVDNSPQSTRDLLRWVDRELPTDGETTRTLEWMLREAAGDPLEAIAEEQQMAAPTVRQRVSRMRRYLRAKWSLQLAAAALGLIVAVGGYRWYDAHHRLPIEPEKFARVQTPREQAAELRRVALKQCGLDQFDICVQTLDRAKDLDPDGDAEALVREARSHADQATRAAAMPSAIVPAMPTAKPTETASDSTKNTAPLHRAPKANKSVEPPTGSHRNQK